MKNLALCICALLVGCSTPQPDAPAQTGPPMPPMPIVRKPALSPKAASSTTSRMLLAGTPAAPPSWAFPDLSGTYQIDASTNLVDWWPVVVVYSVTNVTLTSDTVSKRPMLFFRVQTAE